MKIAVVTDIASGLNQKFLDMYKNLRIVDITYFIDNIEYRETSF